MSRSSQQRTGSDFPHAHGHRRYYPQSVALSDEDEARLSEAAAEYDALIEGYDSEDELPEDVAAKVQALSDEIDAISAKRSAYDPDVIERGGVFVSLGSNGEVRIERGYVRAEDEPQPETEPEDEDAIEPEGGEAYEDAADDDEDEDAPLSDVLVRDLTAHRTLGLRLVRTRKGISRSHDQSQAVQKRPPFCVAARPRSCVSGRPSRPPACGAASSGGRRHACPVGFGDAEWYRPRRLRQP